MVYVFAIVEPDVVPPPEPGFEGAALRTVRASGVAAIVSDLEARVEPSETALWEHEDVVESLMGSGAVLPMRFGSTLADDDAVGRMLGERAGELAAGLARVRGAVELGLRVVEEPEPAEGEAAASREAASVESAGGGVGTTYLMNRLGEARRAESLVEQVHAPLARLARAGTHRVLATSPRGVMTGAYLVEEARVDEFRDAVEELDRQLDAAAIVCTGPWPPYSFTPVEEPR